MQKNIFNLEGRLALVTGAASGLGEHFAHVLARAGATVVCAARREDRISGVAQAIREAGGEAHAVQIDVSSRESVRQAFDKSEAIAGRPVDVLVNCAGQAALGPFTELPEEQWMAAMDVNVNGAWRASQEMARRLGAVGQPGSIVNISSIVGLLGKPMFANYAATKAALIQLTRNGALDLGAHGIRVNALAPGYFASEMTSWYYETDDGRKEIESLPAGRLGRLDELDGPLLLLTSDAGSYINGAVLTVDYGHSARLS